jgi:predicted transcriptional regulator of viral defense system
MEFRTRSLSPKESRVVLALTEKGQRDVSRTEVLKLLGGSPQAADQTIRSLQDKGWLERAGWGRYLLVPPELGPDALGDSNLLALASQLADTYYIGFGSAAAHYGLTTQHRNVIYLVTPRHLRSQKIQDTEVRIINLGPRRFFGYGPVDVYGYPVNMTDREKTVLDCIDRPELAGGVGEAALIFATGVRRFDWQKAADYLEKIGSVALVRRAGFLAAHAGAEIPDTIRLRLHNLSNTPGVSFWGPRKAPRDAVGFNSDWRITINVSKDDLAESAGLAKTRSMKRTPHHADPG